MAAPDSRLWDVASDVLAAVVTYHGGALPARQYISAGPPAWDCELLAVWAETAVSNAGNIAVEVTEPHPTDVGHRLRHATLVIEVVRCAPTPDDDGTPPSAADEEAASLQLLTDAMACQRAVLDAEAAGTLKCMGVAIERWVSLGPQGGLVGGQLRVRVGLGLGS